MTCQALYNGALKIIAENGDEYAIADYTGRFPYLMALFCHEVADTDKRYRTLHQMGEQPVYSPTSIALTDTFPFCDRFVTPCEYFMASTLVMDENPTLSDTLFDKYSDAMATIVSELPGVAGGTTDVYDFAA